MERILYKKYKKNYSFFELIMQYYLLKKKFRKIAQIQYYPSSKKYCELISAISFLNKYKIKYRIFNKCKSNDKCFRLVIFGKSKPKLDKKFGKKFAKQLGKFYIFASKDYMSVVNRQDSSRISIWASNKYCCCELFAQWGKTQEISEKMTFFLDYVKKLEKVYRNLDKNIAISIRITQ